MAHATGSPSHWATARTFRTKVREHVDGILLGGLVLHLARKTSYCLVLDLIDDRLESKDRDRRPADLVCVVRGRVVDASAQLVARSVSAVLPIEHELVPVVYRAGACCNLNSVAKCPFMVRKTLPEWAHQRLGETADEIQPRRSPIRGSSRLPHAIDVGVGGDYDVVAANAGRPVPLPTHSSTSGPRVPLYAHHEKIQPARREADRRVHPVVIVPRPLG